MIGAEFSRLWALFEELFPAAARKKSEKTKTVWRKAVEPYSLNDVTAAVIEYARKNNFFPDIADITRDLKPDEQWTCFLRFGESPIAHNAKLLAKIKQVPIPCFETDAEYMRWARNLRGEINAESKSA